MLWKRLKAIYYKEGFDYSEGYIDPSSFHLTFFWWQRAYQVCGEPFKPWTYAIKLIIIMFAITVFADACLSFYHAIDIFDMGQITEAGTYVLMLLHEAMTLISTKINYDDYCYLISAIKEDFRYICTKNAKYREAFFKIQLGTWKACFGSVCFMIWVATSLASIACLVLINYYLTHTPGDGSHRMLVFPFWAPGVDYTATPAFEIAFVFANVGVYASSFNYTFVLQNNIVWIRQISTKAEMIRMSIKELLEGIHPTDDEEQKRYFNGLIVSRMKEILTQHLLMYRLIKSYVAVYKKCLMFEQIIVSPLVCMLAYCSAEKIDAGEFHVVMLVLLCGTTMVLFVPCYLCTYLRSRLMSISDACWEIRFWDAGPCIRPYLVLIMQRCSRPLPLQAPGFLEVSIQTFSGKMASAYSLFNMLRQADLDF